MRSVNDVRDERGAATVEFLGLTLVLLIPVVYLMIYVSQVQAAAFASVAAADQAVKAVVADADHPSAGAAHATVELALADYGVGAGQYDLTVAAIRAAVARSNRARSSPCGWTWRCPSPSRRQRGR